MQLTGLITEYNPFHNGHLYHMETAKKMTNSDGVVVVMSGNFVQRGTPAIFDKWTRTELALVSGADLVVELPFLYATGSAEQFSLGAIRILNGLQIKQIVFGSETGQIEPLESIAHILYNEPEAYKIALKKHLEKGFSFPRARAHALEDYAPENASIQHPNDILGVEYIKAALSIRSDIVFKTLKRVSSHYHDTKATSQYSSATSIRKAYFDGFLEAIEHTLPPATYNFMRTHLEHAVHPESMTDMLLYKLRSMSATDLSQIHDISEGLENRIKSCAERSTTYDQLLESIKSKRYVKTRIQRVLLNALMNVKASLVKEVIQEENALYARVLGFNDTGRQIMNSLKKNATIPFITNVNKFTPHCTAMQTLLEYDMTATDIYTLLNGTKQGALDKLKSPIYFSEKFK